MIRLADQPTAQYLFAGDTRTGGAGVRVGDVEMGGFHVYLGILTPAALSRVGMPRAEERLGKTASIYLHTLFDGVRGGLGVIRDGAPESLARVVAEATRQQHAVETDARFRHALQTVRQYREPQCLAFELTLSSAGVIAVGMSPHTRIEQANRGYGQVSFLPHRPVRIWLQSAIGPRAFQVQVG
jgi:hypothetical protein